MSTRRQLSWRARQGSQRIKEGSRIAAVTFWGDFTNPKLIPIKFVFFIIMGATQVVAPFGTLQMRTLGLNLQEVGWIYTLGPLIPIMAPLLAGFIADKLGNFRGVLIFTVALSGLISLIYVTIPPARTNPNYSDTLSLGLTCSKKGFILTPDKPKKAENKCEFYNRTVTVSFAEVKNCGYSCPDPVVKYPPLMLKKIKKAKIVQTVNSTLYHMCDIQDSRKNNKFVQKCFRVNLNKSMAHEFLPRNFSLHNLDIRLDETALTTKPYFWVDNAPMSPDHALKFDCVNGQAPKKILIPKMVISERRFENSDGAAMAKCHFHCNVEVPHNLTCDNRAPIEHDVSLSFWMYVGTSLLSRFFLGLSYTLFEVAVVAILKEHGYEYGLQRIYGSIGGMVFAPLSGYFIDLFKKDDIEHYTDYYVMFIFYCALKIICALMLVKLDLRFKPPAKSICKNVGSLFTNLEVVLLIFIVFTSGMCYGFIENFLPWHLRDLKATNWFIGLLTTIASLSAVPFLAFSGTICKKFGYVQSISFGLICYSIRCIGYSMLKDFYWCMPFEILEGITTGLLIAAAITYGSELSSKSNVATLQGILATFHYGLGKSAGSLVGSTLMTKLGASFSFQVFSGISFIIGFIYYLLGKLIILPRHEKKLKRRREVMAMPVETISRAEHKRMSQLMYSVNPYDNEVDKTPKKAKAPKRDRSPIKKIENIEVHAIENGALDETQMTDLPPDDTMLSTSESFSEDDNRKEKD